MQRLPRLILVSATAFLISAQASLSQDAPQKAGEAISHGDERGVRGPRVIFAPNPDYPDRARKKKIQGTVVVSILVTRDSTVSEAKVAAGLDRDLDEQAVKTVSTWRFEPARKEGKAVAERIQVAVDYRLVEKVP